MEMLRKEVTGIRPGSGQAAEAKWGLPRVQLGSWHSHAFPFCSPGGLDRGLPRS